MPVSAMMRNPTPGPAGAAIGIAVVGAAAILGAYYFQYVLGLEPCPLLFDAYELGEEFVSDLISHVLVIVSIRGDEGNDPVPDLPCLQPVLPVQGPEVLHLARGESHPPGDERLALDVDYLERQVDVLGCLALPGRLLGLFLA